MNLSSSIKFLSPISCILAVDWINGMFDFCFQYNVLMIVLVDYIKLELIVEQAGNTMP